MAMVHLVPFSSKDLIPGERVAVVLAGERATHGCLVPERVPFSALDRFRKPDGPKRTETGAKSTVLVKHARHQKMTQPISELVVTLTFKIAYAIGDFDENDYSMLSYVGNAIRARVPRTSIY